MAPFSVLGKIFGLIKSNNGELSQKRQRRLAEVAERVKVKSLRDMLDELEQRWLPVVSVNLSAGALNITTTAPTDTIFIDSDLTTAT